jgi:hypothetical protein
MSPVVIGLLLIAVGCGSNAPSSTTAANQQNAQAARPAPNPNNELPFGRVDQPQPGAVVKDGKAIASGWAVDDSAVKEVRLYVDSHFRMTIKLTIARNDLQAPLSGYMHGTNLHGWTTEIDLGATPGSHTILAQAEDDQGATHDIGFVTVTVPASP